MNPAEFAAKWIGNQNTERAASQEHFIDLCQMVGAPTPNSDPKGKTYAFEKGATKTSGGDGWADVWMRHRFGWEYKGHHKDLDEAYKQLLDYREALENPPLLVVCDLDRFIVRTNFTNTVRQEYSFTLEDLRDDPAKPLRILHAVFENPEQLKPAQTRAELTERAAGAFAAVAQQLRDAGHDPQRVAHFLNKLLFVLFAEDALLLPPRIIRDLGKNLRSQPAMFGAQLSVLFRLMSTEPGGVFGAVPIQWFNGGLFDGEDVLPLTAEQIDVISDVSLLDWSQVEPAIFGTLFERGLDPSKRSQLGAHYTDRVSIDRVVDPVLIQPLITDWEAVQAQVLALLAPHELGRELSGSALGARTRAIAKAADLVTGFLDGLDAIRVLDPACGSGNFLYVALQALKDLERRVLVWETTELRTTMRFPRIGPHNVRGIELNSYAAELARVSIWIGEIQWMISNGFAYLKNPILRPLQAIECRDAVLLEGDDGPSEPTWPDTDVIIGNPPFLGGKLMRANLGDDYVDELFAVYEGRVPREADFVAYWHEKARAMVATGRAKRVGLLATQGIRGGANRKVLERIKETGDIFFAWSDEPWVVEGAAVRVSIVGYDDGTETQRVLNGLPATTINSDLTGGLDLTRARRLKENRGIAFMGDTKGGPFDIPSPRAHTMLDKVNPHGKSNRDVIRPWVNGLDVTRRPRGMYIIDFGVDTAIEQAMLYEAPFEYVRATVKPVRDKSRTTTRGRWWLHERPRVDMREALLELPRYIATATTAKHRLFVWLNRDTLPDHALIVFARTDDYFFGALHSRAHQLWSLEMGTQLEDRPRYTPSSTFETFPLPRPTKLQQNAVATAAKQLDTWRNGWLNSGGVADLKDRTLTNLYNSWPTWLSQAHEQLDMAVHEAYGWPYPMAPDEILSRLLALNFQRSSNG